MRLINNAWSWLRNTFFIPNRWEEYRGILLSAQNSSYSIIRLDQLATLLLEGKPLPERFLILRHDIDSNAPSALKFCEVERDLGIQASYFFRLSTWNANVIKQVSDCGHEVGYHFEELAAYAKRQHLKTAAAVEEHIGQIRLQLTDNLVRLRRDCEIHSLASHGDFANRRLSLTNCLIAADPAWRIANGILYEAYDPALVGAYQNHVCDRPHPCRYHPCTPLEMIATRKNFLFLIHPRWWQPDPAGNLRESCRRLKDQISW